MPGSDGPRLRIHGLCTCTREGHTVTLEPDNEGIIDDPAVQVFRVRVQEPDFGPDVMTDEPIHYDGPADEPATKVLIRLPDASQVSVDVQDVS